MTRPNPGDIQFSLHVNQLAGGPYGTLSLAGDWLIRLRFLHSENGHEYGLLPDAGPGIM